MNPRSISLADTKLALAFALVAVCGVVGACRTRTVVPVYDSVLTARATEVAGSYRRRVGDTDWTLEVLLRADGEFVVQETHVGFKPVDPVNFYGGWVRQGDRVLLGLRRRTKGVVGRLVVDESIDTEVVGYIVRDESGRVTGLRFPRPSPLHEDMSKRLLRASGS